MSKEKWLIYGGLGIGYAGLISFVFYRSWIAFFSMVPVGVCYPLFVRGDLKQKRQEALLVQFRDAILSLASCLYAGYSVENAFLEAQKDTDRVYGRESMISVELRRLVHKTSMNMTLDEALLDFAERSGLEDIRSFAEVFLASKEHGGELMKMIARTAEIISEKIRVRQEILTVTTSKRLEQKIMSMIPIGIVFYLELTSPGFFDVLYDLAIGRVIMTGCLAVYLGSIILGKKILAIDV